MDEMTSLALLIGLVLGLIATWGYIRLRNRSLALDANEYKAFARINEALDAEFQGRVRIKRCDWSEHPYMLHFEDDNPPKATIQKAKRIVNQYLPSQWFDDEARVVK